MLYVLEIRYGVTNDRALKVDDSKETKKKAVVEKRIKEEG
jgi:hypothetical protein